MTRFWHQHFSVVYVNGTKSHFTKVAIPVWDQEKKKKASANRGLGFRVKMNIIDNKIEKRGPKVDKNATIREIANEAKDKAVNRRIE